MTSRCNSAGIRLLLGLTILIVTVLALSPGSLDLPSIPHTDKALHLLTYLVLAYLVDAGWPEVGFTPRKWILLLTYGLLIELIQTQIPYRYFSLGDIAANALGIGLYVFAIAPLLRRLRLR